MPSPRSPDLPSAWRETTAHPITNSEINIFFMIFSIFIVGLDYLQNTEGGKQPI
jgi:hypothetical protein